MPNSTLGSPVMKQMGMKETASPNTFISFTKSNNLNQTNPGVSWSIVDPNNILLKKQSFCIG